MNIQLLTGTVQRLINTPGATLERFEETARTIWADLCKRCIIGWGVEELSILGTKLQLPLLNLNYNEIARAKAELSRPPAYSEAAGRHGARRVKRQRNR
jgi:hypothetical protein